ncbi:glutamine amidotransferase [Staphylococcus condimenti]|uniref:Aminodeoxychorismate/anthranilate synthase component II n=1 Tax=Staphylococcus condimenti TaxID=70255 RepID=A0A143P8P3_9STAP|nr:MULTISPECIES: aminodeoxychorismate/anthranilate synthase component II [Staphylococcus]AMY04836.1 anthranilate synthase component II [Staphylococcus condimenti]APR61079.1 glutamine amidotransferase [Staphylococcus condimenti]MDK8644109.1 aminodeoxychorismate/anthranilate synthase component II [Staphylococcus condimenti]OFP01426.1 glutamine amidotransferase [Staphylococcus sp. HMSC065E08]PNZ60323.1 glutamine amidotransferase [Staphylococcus condimenti]
MILIIDNYDSFTYNLVNIAAGFTDVVVKYPDDPTVFDLNPDGIIISPGPGHPEDTEDLKNIINHYHELPILGICLGSQALTCYYGGKVIQGETVLHGKIDTMHQTKQTVLYENLPESFKIMRYHSLISDPKTFPEVLEITGETADCIQSFAHKQYPHYGIQYHPESFATEHGADIIQNFIHNVEKGAHRHDTHSKNSTTKQLNTAGH